MFRKIRKILYRSIENREISYKKLQEMIKKYDNAILVDVRSSQEFDENHLDGAINIPIFDLNQIAEKILKDKEQIIITYCSTGSRSRRAKEMLETLEYENVYNLKNGLDGI